MNNDFTYTELVCSIIFLNMNSAFVVVGGGAVFFERDMEGAFSHRMRNLMHHKNISGVVFMFSEHFPHERYLILRF